MINRNKTEGLWIGKLKHSKDKEENIKWTNKPIKTLGIYYGPIKVKIGIIKALMISTLPNIERFRFDHDKNKLFIFSIFFSQLSFSHSISWLFE
jgi:Na+/glutamate symporter